PDNSPNIEQHDETHRTANADRVRLVARITLAVNRHHKREELDETERHDQNEHYHHYSKNAPVFDYARHLLNDDKLEQEENDRISQPGENDGPRVEISSA